VTDDRLAEIKRWYERASLNREEIAWLIAEIERLRPRPHPYVQEQHGNRTGGCLLIVGPGQICAKSTDDPVHADPQSR
jgi:hypothetical protein